MSIHRDGRRAADGMAAGFAVPHHAQAGAAGAVVHPRWRAGMLWWQAPAALALVALAVFSFGFSPASVLPCYLAVVSPELCFRDITERRLPNALVVPGYGFAGVQLIWLGFATGRMPWVAVIASVAMLAFFLLLNVAGGMGMGDVKLVGLIGVALGSVSVTVAVLGPMLAFVVGGIAGLIVVATPSATRLKSIPFGPYLLFGLWAAPPVAAALA